MAESRLRAPGTCSLAFGDHLRPQRYLGVPFPFRPLGHSDVSPLIHLCLHFPGFPVSFPSIHLPGSLSTHHASASWAPSLVPSLSRSTVP